VQLYEKCIANCCTKTEIVDEFCTFCKHYDLAYDWLLNELNFLFPGMKSDVYKVKSFVQVEDNRWFELENNGQ
jgi:hypothetical protein